MLQYPPSSTISAWSISFIINDCLKMFARASFDLAQAGRSKRLLFCPSSFKKSRGICRYYLEDNTWELVGALWTLRVCENISDPRRSTLWGTYKIWDN